ncbi:MAG: tetratricopeptide repeat protein [Bacteroidota bacterium]
MITIRRILFLLILLGPATGALGQKSRVLAVFQMIDQGKYTEAKENIELAVWNDKTSRWHRTYYAKGLLCQTAYEDGYKKKDSKKTGLYPDQLYVAYDAYQQALELDARKRLHTSVSHQYYLLSNDFRQLGEDQFSSKRYDEALRAFEYALIVNQSKLINAKVDTSLVYNTAMAAYESKNWEKAIGYLTGLHDDAYEPAASLLLYKAHLESGDSLRAEEVLMEGVKLYHYENQAVVYLVNLLVRTERHQLAIEVLDEAIAQRPDNFRFLWGRGLVYRRMGEFDKALPSFKAALELSPEEPKIYYHIGVIYYNKGIDLTEKSLNIRDNDKYIVVKEEATAQYTEAVKWLEHSYELDPFSEKTISRLYQLYYQLQMTEKMETMKLLIE